MVEPLSELEELYERAEELVEELSFTTDAEVSVEDVEDVLATYGEDLSPDEVAEILGL